MNKLIMKMILKNNKVLILFCKSSYIRIFLLSFLFYSCNACTKDEANKPNVDNQKLVYYFNSIDGNDSNKGTSPEQAFKTLEKASNLELNPGTKLLFKGGNVFTGQLNVSGSGEAQNPIIISNYGNNQKPRFDGEGEKDYTIHVYNCNYIELRNLEITNTGSVQKAHRRGVIVEADDCKLSKHIILDNFFIHDVNGHLVKKKGAGSAILWQNHGDNFKTKFDSLIIENCHIKDCARNAINSRGYTNRESWYPSTNVIIRNNLIEGVPGDGIVPIGTDGAVVEYNVMRDCPDVMPKGDAAAGIWPWSADNTLIQYNEVSDHKAKWDGQGFDSDWNCQNTIIQYNYSHDNYGGFLLVCNNGSTIGKSNNIGTTNTIVRYNISVNDGIRPYESDRRSWFSPLMHISGPVEGTILHHNIFIIPEKESGQIDRTVVHMDNWGGPWPRKTFFYKNIFDFSEEHKMDYGKAQKTFAMSNLVVDKPFDLIEQKDQEVPEWAIKYVNEIDSDYRDKLIQTFFKNNSDLKQIINSFNQ